MSDHSFNLTRRAMLHTGGVASAGLWIGLHPGLARAMSAASGAASSATSASTPDFLKRSTYTSLSSPAFTDVSDGSQSLQLSLVGDLDDPSLIGADDAFRLALTSSGTPLDGGIRTLSHPQIGQFDVFISPVGMPGSTTTYEVIVDRAVTADPVAAAPAPTSPAATSAAGNASATTQTAPGPSAGAAGGSSPGGAATSSGTGEAGRSGIATAEQVVAHESVVRRVTVRRAAGGVIVDVFLRPGADVASLRVGLRRGGHRLAAAGAKVHGAHTRLELHTHHRPAAGHYDAVVTANAAHGAPQITVFPVALH